MGKVTVYRIKKEVGYLSGYPTSFFIFYMKFLLSCKIKWTIEKKIFPNMY